MLQVFDDLTGHYRIKVHVPLERQKTEKAELNVTRYCEQNDTTFFSKR